MLPDIQDQNDNRNLAINKVGIKGLSHPIKIENNNKVQCTIGSFDISVSLAKDKKGTHMSRLVEVVNQSDWIINLPTLSEIVCIVQTKLDAKDIYLKLDYVFFLEKEAPISKIKSKSNYDVTLKAIRKENITSYITSIKIPVTSLCPCSKEISDFGAHNQRTIVEVELHHDEEIDHEKIITLVEETSSCELYALLKRVDEKYVTEKAYENPKFVEDIVRDVAIIFDNNKKIKDYSVSATSLESIHNHQAYAFIKKTN